MGSLGFPPLSQVAIEYCAGQESATVYGIVGRAGAPPRLAPAHAPQPPRKGAGKNSLEAECQNRARRTVTLEHVVVSAAGSEVRNKNHGTFAFTARGVLKLWTQGLRWKIGTGGFRRPAASKFSWPQLNDRKKLFRRRSGLQKLQGAIARPQPA